MLVLFEKLASCLRGRITLIVVTLMVSLGLLLWVLLGTSAEFQDRWLIPSVLLSVWLLLLFSGTRLFTGVPSAAGVDESWRMRIAVRVKRFFYHLFAWFMLAVSVALVVMTFQLTMAWMRMHM